MQQYFIDQKLRINEHFSFNDEQKHHLLNVLRMKNKEQVYVVDSDNTRFLVCLNINENTLMGEAIKEETFNSEISNHIYIAQGLIKGERWDYFIEKSVEFGAHDIIPLILKNNVVKIKDDVDKKVERWNKIALSAAKQSKRTFIPTVHKPMTLNELVKKHFDHQFVAYEKAIENRELVNYLNKLQDHQSIVLVVGSEGGLEANEVSFLESHQFVVSGLGPRILRAEDASIYFLSALSIIREY